MADIAVINNEPEQRYEALIDGDLALAAYQLQGGTIIFTHTEVPERMEGRGVGSALAKAALDDARNRKLTIVPLCPFISSYIQRHPEYLDSVDDAHRARLASDMA